MKAVLAFSFFLGKASSHFLWTEVKEDSSEGFVTFSEKAGKPDPVIEALGERIQPEVISRDADPYIVNYEKQKDRLHLILPHLESPCFVGSFLDYGLFNEINDLQYTSIAQVYESGEDWLHYFRQIIASPFNDGQAMMLFMG